MTFLQKVRAWMRQPTTVAGASAFSGALFAVLTHSMTMAEGIPLMVGALVAIAMPDNTQAQTEAKVLAADAVKFTGAVTPMSGQGKILPLLIMGALLAGALSGCTTQAATASIDAASAMDASVKILTDLDKAATVYAELPACPAPAGTVACSDPATVSKLKLLASSARTQIEGAQNGSTPVATALQALATYSAAVNAL